MLGNIEINMNKYKLDFPFIVELIVFFIVFVICLCQIYSKYNYLNSLNIIYAWYIFGTVLAIKNRKSQKFNFNYTIICIKSNYNLHLIHYITYITALSCSFALKHLDTFVIVSMCLILDLYALFKTKSAVRQK